MKPNPVRINLEDRTKQDFIADVLLCFPVVDHNQLGKFYEQVAPLYRVVLLDLNSGELLMGLTYNSGWIVCNHYLKHVPTPDKVSDDDDEAQTPNPQGFKLDQQVIDRLINKIGNEGYESLSVREQEYLKKTSKHLREGDK